MLPVKEQLQAWYNSKVDEVLGVGPEMKVLKSGQSVPPTIEGSAAIAAAAASNAGRKVQRATAPGEDLPAGRK